MRRAFVALLVTAFAAAGCGGSSGGETWRFAIEEIEGSVQHAWAERFAALVAERTGGTVDVRVYPYGSLGTSAQLTEQVQSGALQLAFASPGHLGSVIPEVQVFSLHFLLSDDEAANQRILDARDVDWRRLLDEAYREHRLELLAIVPEGWMVWTADRPLRSPADFAGLKMRTMVSPLLVEAYAAYGANPTPMPYSEVYSGLQLGMIDAQVNPVFAIEEMSFYEVQDFMTFAHHAPFVSTVVTSPEFLSGLAPERQALLREVVRELGPWALETQRRFNAERLERILAEGGIEVVELDADERAACRAASLPVRDVYRELAGPRGEAILASLVEAVAAGTGGDDAAGAGGGVAPDAESDVAAPPAP
jgi:tripartite ATP-independent transporter DctP family solute receptor